MANLFLSGWACDSFILPPNVAATFFDTTKEIQCCVDGDTLLPNWKKLLKEKITPLTSKDTTIVSWSTGSMILLALLEEIPFKECFIYAPALRFIESSKNPKGTKEIHLQAMIDAIDTGRDLTMKKFFRNAGAKELHDVSSSYSNHELKTGLLFLKSIEIRPTNLSEKVHLFHGIKDRIIPFSAGEIVAQEGKSEITTLEGGHFQEQMFSHFSD